MQTPSSKSFPVESMGKFTILYFITVGLYSYYWFYRNWVVAEVIAGKPMFKIGRTLFAIFFVHELFFLVQSEQKSEAHQHRWQPKKLAGIFVGIGVVALIFALMQEYSETIHWWDLLIFWIALLVQFYVLYTVQLVMNRLAGDPFGDANNAFKANDVGWFAVGFLLWMNIINAHYLIFTGKVPPKTPIDPPVNQEQALDPIV